jgi:hypothetical protein
MKEIEEAKKNGTFEELKKADNDKAAAIGEAPKEVVKKQQDVQEPVKVVRKEPTREEVEA